MSTKATTKPNLVFVGLDVHKDSIQVCILNRKGKELYNRSVNPEVGQIVERILRFGPAARVGLEACGGSAVLADELIQATGWSVQLSHPGYAQRMRQNPDKSDYSDAFLMADLVRVGYLPKVWLAPPAIRDLRHLIRYRQQVVNQRRNVKLRIRAMLREHRVQVSCSLWTLAGIKWLRDEVMLPSHARWILDRHLTALKQLADDLVVVAKRLKDAADNDSTIQRLLKQNGIGLVTALVLRAEIGDVNRFSSGKQLSRFCGLSPRNASSGNRQADSGLIRGCSRLLRSTLIEAAHRLTVRDPYWKAFKSRMRAAGKPGSLIAAAVANRWMRRLFHDLRDSGLEEKVVA